MTPTEARVTTADMPLARRRFYTLLLLAVIAGAFAASTLSWVQFFRLPPDAGGAGGDRVRLFTQTDFPAVVIASRIAASGRGSDLYKLSAQYAEQGMLRAEGYLHMSDAEASGLRYPYPYTPPIAVFWSPLSGLPPLAQMALWDLLNIVAFSGGLWLLLKALPLLPLQRNLILLGGITSFPFVTNLEQGQSSGPVMLAFGAGIAMLYKGRDLPAGLLFGLLILKVQWLPFLVLVLIWKRRWYALLGLLGTFLVMSLVVFLVLGTSWLPDYLQLAAQAQAYSPDLLLNPSFSHSLTGALSDLFGRGDASVLPVVRVTNTLAMLGLAGALLYLWRGEWEPSQPRWSGLLCLTFLATIFTNPQLNTHDLCLLAVPAALGMVFAANLGISRHLPWYFACLTAYFAPVPVFLLGVDFPVRLTALSILLMLGLVLVWLAYSARPRAASDARV